MSIIVDGTILAARGASLNSLVSGYIAKKQQTLQALYEQQAVIEDLYNNVSSGLYTTQSSLYQLNTYYNSQISSKNSLINTLQAQIRIADNKISALNSMHSSLKTTVTSLDSFLESVRAAANTASTIDFSNTNTDALDVSITNSTNLTTQRIEYEVKQIATATTATSYVFNGYNLSSNTLIKDVYAGTYDSSILTGTRTNLDETMTMKQLGITEGRWDIGDVTLYISKNDTLKDVADQLKACGYAAGVRDGMFYIDGRNIKAMNIHDQQSNFGETLGLTISTGTFSINGKTVNITDSTSIQNLVDNINSDLDYGVAAVFKNNQLLLVANQTGNVLIEINKGSSNFTNVAGFTLGGKMISDNLVIGSDGSKQMLTATNNISSIAGNISSGQFTLTKIHNGIAQKATITVTQGANLQETLNNIKTQINSSSLNVTAEIENDKFVIKNNELGEGYEFIFEAGDSDFTEKVGFTNPVLSTGTPSFDSNTNYFTTLTGITNITSTTDNIVTAGSFKINGTTINLAAGSLESAITTINSYKNTTGVIADVVGNHMILRNEFTGDTNLYVEGGTSNFGEISGFTTQSINAATATTGQIGTKSTLTGSETVSNSLRVNDSVIKINGTTVNISGGELSNVIAQLNLEYSDDLNVVFSINASNKLMITEKRNGNLPISVTSVSGNFAELTGIAGYQTSVGREEKYGSSRTTFTATREVSNSTQILDSTIKINDQQINLSGSISDAILTINARSATTGVEAYIDTNNKFTLRNTAAGTTGINFEITSGDFGRVIGSGSYSTAAGTTTHTDRQLATVTGACTGLNEFTQVLAGSKIQFGTTIIDLGASVGAALLAINTHKEVTGVEAFLNDNGQFVLQAISDEKERINFKVIGSGNFGSVTGLGSYTVGAAPSNGEIENATYSKIVGSKNVDKYTEITATSITLGYQNDLGTNVTKTFLLSDGTLDDAIKQINDSNWYVKAEIVDDKLQFISRSTGQFYLTMAVNPINGVTGDFGNVVGMGNSKSAAASKSSLDKDPATYTGATTGLTANDELIGTNKIRLWMTDPSKSPSEIASVAETITFADKDGDGKISIQDAIDSINTAKNTTKIEASLQNGQFVLTQIDANTPGEGTTINFVVEGDGDFNRVAGFGSYTTTGQSNTGVVSGQSFTTLVGGREISDTNEVLASQFTINLRKGDAANCGAVDITTTINISDGTIADAITSINTQLANAHVGITASIVDGKLQLKSNTAGNFNISVNMDNSDFGRIVGIGSHSTNNGTATYVNKTAAKITGGVSGLTRDSNLAGSVQITLQGLVTRTTTGVNTEGGLNNAASSVRTITLSGNIGNAIDAINAQTSSTQIRAYLDAEGRFVLEQTNQNTANEFDTIAFSLTGSGDFGYVTGYGAYTTYGSSDTGNTIGKSYSYISGVTENLKGTEQITAGKARITLIDDVNSWNAASSRTFEVSISGTVEEVAQQITTAAAAGGYSLEAYIDENNGRFVIKSTSYGKDQINISIEDSDFGRITGIANYSLDYATVVSGHSTYNQHPVLSGGNEITEDTISLSGTLVVDGQTISTVNKTMAQIAQEVNNLHIDGVTASAETGYFTIKMLENNVGSPISVEATGDFARLTGLGEYSVGSASYVDGSCTITDGTPTYTTKSVMGLDENTKLVGGSITITHSDGHNGTTSFTIDTTGKTIGYVVNKINEYGQAGENVESLDGYSLNYVYASFENGQISIKTNENAHTITATGDFARITGFSEYHSGAAQCTAATTTTETGTLRYTSKNSSVLSGDTVFSDGSIRITFDNGASGTQTIGLTIHNQTVNQVVEALRNQANSIAPQESIDGFVINRPEISFDESTGKISIVTYGESHDISVTGSFASLTGFNDEYEFSINAMPDIVTYNRDGLLIGGTNTSVGNGTAIAGQEGTIDFYDGENKIGSIEISATDSLNNVLTKINNMVVNNPAPDSTSNINYDPSITASVVGGRIQLRYGAGMESLRVSGTSAFVYFYGLGATETSMTNRSTVQSTEHGNIYEYTDGSITGSVDIKNFITSGSLTVGETGIGAFAGQKHGTLTFVSTIDGELKAIGNVEIRETDSLDDVMAKINEMTSCDEVAPDGTIINRINGFTASFTADGKIQITYGGQHGALRIRDESGFAQYYGLTSSEESLPTNYSYSQEERYCPDTVGKSTVTGSSIGYSEAHVLGGLRSGILSVSLNGKTINVAYENTESISTILGRVIETANQTDGSGLFDYNGELEQNIKPLTKDNLTYSINENGQIVLSGAVESRTSDKLEIFDVSGNFARITGIATTPNGYTEPTGTVVPSPTPGIVVNGTDYIVTKHSYTGSHGSFSYYGASINGLTGNTVISGLNNGGFYLETTGGNKWVSVNKTDTVNDVLAKINALDPSKINAVFDETNNRIKITATDNALQRVYFSGDTSGFIQRAGLGLGDQTYDADYTSTSESYGNAKLWSSVGTLHSDHKLSNIQGGINANTETITISDGVGSINITVSDDESLNSIINKIKTGNKFDAGITDGKLWIQSLANSSQEITLSESNFARILGFNTGNETLGNGIQTVGEFGIMNYTGASVAGLLSSTNLTIDSSLTGTGDGTFTVTLSDNISNTINIATKSFEVTTTENMTVDDIITAIKTSAVNAGVTGFDISFDNSTHKISISVSANQAEKITFTGNDEKGTELVRRLGLATSNNTTVKNGTNITESAGYTRITGSIDGFHDSHVFGNLATESFTISGPNGNCTINVTSGQSLNQIISEINTQSSGKYIAGIDTDGRFYIQSEAQSANNITVTSTDFTRRVGLLSSNVNNGPSSQTTVGSSGTFIFYGAGGTGGTGIDGMTSSTVFSEVSTGSFNFTLGATGITTPTGELLYHSARTFTVNVSAGDSIQTILEKMQTAITNAGGYSASDINFSVEVDEATHKGRIRLEMNGKDASEIVFSNDNTDFTLYAGLSNTGITTPENYTSINRSYGKANITGSVENLRGDHVFGNQQAGTMIISAGSVTTSINIAANASIQNVINDINSDGKFVADIDERGRIKIKSVNDTANDITVSGTSDFFKLAGLNAGSWAYTGTEVSGSFGYSKITGSVAGLTGDQKFNNMTSGDFTISAAGLRTLTVSATAGVTKISDVIDYINNTATSDYEASLNAEGQVVINTKVANGATVTIRDGSSNYAAILGLTSGIITSRSIAINGQDDKYSTLTGSTTGLDTNAKFSSGDFIISVKAPDNTIKTQKFTLAGTESLSTITATISASSLGINAYVDATTGQLVFESRNEGEYEIFVEDGTSNFAETTGLSRNHAQIQPATRGTLATLTSTKTANNASMIGFTAGTFFVSLTDKNGNITSSQKITIADGDTVNDIATKITNCGIGISATVDPYTDRLVLTRNSSTTDGGLVVTKGTSDFTNKIGLTIGGEQSASAIVTNGTNPEKTVFYGKALPGTTSSTRLGSIAVTSGTIIINNKIINVSENDTIQGFVNKINNAFSATDPNGVQAKFENNKIILSSNLKSDNARISIETGSSNVSEIFGFTNGATLNTSNQLVGVRAKISLNGVNYESMSNYIALDKNGNVVDVGSAEEAVLLTLQNLGTGIIDIGKKSVEETYLKLLTFANKFNTSMIVAQNPALSDDIGFQTLISNLKSAITDDIGSTRRVEKALSDIGITLYSTLAANGSTRLSISINKEKFENAMVSTPNKVLDLLIGNDAEPLDYQNAGSLTRLKATIEDTLKPVSGYFKSNSRILSTQKQAIQKELTIAKGEMAELEAELTIIEKDNEAAKQQEELEHLLEDITEQYETISNLINKLDKQYTKSMAVLSINKNNWCFN